MVNLFHYFIRICFLFCTYHRKHLCMYSGHYFVMSRNMCTGCFFAWEKLRGAYDTSLSSIWSDTVGIFFIFFAQNSPCRVLFCCCTSIICEMGRSHHIVFEDYLCLLAQFLPIKQVFKLGWGSLRYHPHHHHHHHHHHHPPPPHHHCQQYYHCIFIIVRKKKGLSKSKKNPKNLNFSHFFTRSIFQIFFKKKFVALHEKIRKFVMC